MTMQRPVLVGGPLLGDRSTFTRKDNKHTNKIPNDLKSWNCFKPLITPSFGDEQFVLLPSPSFVTVLAYKTGRRVATLIPFMEKENIKNEHMIESACLATFSSQEQSQHNVADALRKMGNNESEAVHEQQGDSHVLLVGCRDGSIREFDLSVLVRAQHQLTGNAVFSSTRCGSFNVVGECHRPRRVFNVSTEPNQPIKHLTGPLNVALKNGNALVYALAETSALKKEKVAKSKHQRPSVQYSLLRVQLPPFHRNEHTNNKIISNDDNNSDCVVVQDSLKCTVGYDKEKRFQNTAPFRLLSVSTKATQSFSPQQDNNCNIFVVIGRSNKFHVYHERVQSGNVTQPKMQFTSFPITDRRNPLMSISIAPNGTDVTCGYVDGDICIMSDALPRTLDYFEHLASGKTAPPHPSTTVLNRRVHWHAHPVTSLTYQSATSSTTTVDPMLYSGGNESVLVTWQLSRGTYRPAHVLPRLAKGGIVHIAYSSQDGILVYCEDNTLQLFAAHNKSLLWNVQGLASLTGESLGKSSTRVQPTIRAGSISNTVILSGLPGAPGYLHWYNVREQRVTEQLEVAPFNRVSRTEVDDSPMPVPSVTNCAFSESGRDLVTVDTMPTENSGVGATERLCNGSAIGVVTTLRFWSRDEESTKRNPKAGPYSLTAAMTFPHGEENQITAVAISNDGKYACTVSDDDNAFRLWHKVLSEETDEQDADSSRNRRTPVWMCKFKVTTPSGYSNFATGSNAVGFSLDGSILAICYGNMITLWDHKEAALLTSLLHLDDDRAPVESLYFIKTSLLNDLILTRSRSGIALQSPYGKGKESWSCTIPADYKDAVVTHAEMVPNHNSVAVCMTFRKKAESHVLLVDATTGSPRTFEQGDKTKPLLWRLPGTIRSIGVQSIDTKRSSNWVDVDAVQDIRSEKTEPSPVRLYATLSNGNMVLLSTEESSDTLEATSVNARWHQTGSNTSNAPRLSMLKRGDGRKRKREQDASVAMMGAPLAKRSMASIFGSSFGDEDSESTPLPSSELPSLGGAFTRAFVSRNLASNRQGDGR